MLVGEGLERSAEGGVTKPRERETVQAGFRSLVALMGFCGHDLSYYALESL